MKEQKKIIFGSGTIAIISFVLSVSFELELDRLIVPWPASIFTGHRGFLISLTLGVFTGALLSTVIATISYTIEKERYISEFTELCEDFCTSLRKLPYLYFEADVDLWAPYYNESEREKSGFYGISGSEDSTTAYQNLLNWYKSNYPNGNAEFFLERRKKEIEDQMPNVIKSYLIFCGFNISAFDRMIKRGSFIFSKSKKQKAIKSTCDLIKRSYKFIIEKTCYMESFHATNNILKTICSLQSAIFSAPIKSESTVLLPPENKLERYIINCLNGRGAENE